MAAAESLPPCSQCLAQQSFGSLQVASSFQQPAQIVHLPTAPNQTNTLLHAHSHKPTNTIYTHSGSHCHQGDSDHSQLT